MFPYQPHPSNTILVSQSWGTVKEIGKRFGNIYEAFDESTSDDCIIVYPGTYVLSRALRFDLMNFEYANTPKHENITGSPFVFCYPGVKFINDVFYNTETGDVGALTFTDAGRRRALHGYARVYNSGSSTAPSLFVHAGHSGAGDQIIELDAIYHNFSGASCVLLEDSDGVIKINTIESIHDDNPGAVALEVINSEAKNTAHIHCSRITSTANPISMSTGTTSKFFLYNCYVQKKASGLATPVVNDLSVGLDGIANFVGCSFVNLENDANAPGFLLGGISGVISLRGCGIQVTNASALSFAGTGDIGTVGSIANTTIDGTVTQKWGTLTVDADFQIHK